MQLFLEGSKASASLVAEEDTVVQVMKAYYLNVLFRYKPQLAGRFYHYLAFVLANSLAMKEEAKCGAK